MVGDSPEADVRGGYDLGLSTIWLRHGRSWNEASYSPTSVADSLVEALDTLLTHYSRKFAARRYVWWIEESALQHNLILEELPPDRARW